MKLIRKILTLFRREKLESEMAQEMAHHLEELRQSCLAAGMSPEEAHFAAYRQFGGLEQIKERVREQRGQAWEQFWRDVRFAGRFLVKDRAFSALAVLVLTLGIGGVATQFSVVNGLLLRPPAYPQPERLVSVSLVDTQRNQAVRGVSFSDYLEWQNAQRSFQELAAYVPRLSINITHRETPRRYTSAYITHNFFRTLGVAPIRGRDFTADDDRENAARTVIISHDVWQNDFDGAADVVGRAIRINGRSGTVIGVMPPGFGFPLNEQAWSPLFAEFPIQARANAQIGTAVLLGRLNAGVMASQATAELTGFVRRSALESPATNRDLATVVVAPFTEAFLGREVRQVMLFMLSAVVVVFLIACVNVMNMQFARATRRLRDLAVCSALGASRGRLLRQMLIESLLLAVTGAIGGTLLAVWGTDALLQHTRTLRAPPPSWVTFDLDGRVVAVLAIITIGATVLSGVVPAWFASRSRPLELLREGGRSGPGRHVNLAIRSLVILQIALTAALLVVSSFMIRSIVNQQRIDWGYDTKSVLTARMTLYQSDYPSVPALAQFLDRTLRNLRADPHFSHAALSTRFRLAIPTNLSCEVEGAGDATGHAHPRVAFEGISDGYFATLGLDLVAGRDFSTSDTADGLPVAIINTAFAQKHFPQQNPLGRRVRLLPSNNSPGRWLTIVGVAPDTRMQGPADGRSDGAGIFQPLSQAPQRWITIAVRGPSADPMTLAEPLRRAMAATEKDLPIYLVNTAAFVIDETLAQNRLLTSLFVIFGGVAMLLAAVGLYGMMSFAVNQRTREYGIRMALGADGWQILRATLHEGAAQLGLGLALGLMLALVLVALGRAVMQEFLYQVSAADPLVWGSTVLLLSVVALMACFVPARRAAKVDPMTALRAE